jgi:hypothetical protein
VQEIDQAVPHSEEVDARQHEGVVEVEDECRLRDPAHRGRGFRPQAPNLLKHMASRQARLRKRSSGRTGVVSEGEKAPDFTLPDDQGRSVSLKDFRGTKVVLWFYVRDFTPG